MKSAISQADLTLQMQRLIDQVKQVNTARPAQPVGNDFMSVLNNSIQQVSTMQKTSQDMATAFQKGTSNVDLADVMIAAQKSSISFQAMVQVRNKFISAYQEIMNMQI